MWKMAALMTQAPVAADPNTSCLPGRQLPFTFVPTPGNILTSSPEENDHHDKLK